MHQGKPVRVTCSFGVAQQGSEPSMIDIADKALYQAKREGRDRVCAPGLEPEALAAATEPPPPSGEAKPAA
jgi:hypothetical protein